MPTPPRSTLNADYQRDWPEYFDAVKGQPPRDTLLRALALFDQSPSATPRLALDLACGEGRDTRAILERGWHVVATDSHPDAITRTVTSLSTEAAARCQVVKLAMEDVPDSPALTDAIKRIGNLCASANKPATQSKGQDQANSRLHLINASFALPFCHPDRFPVLWSWIGRTLTPTGRFAGQFFGDRDEWACVRPKSHVTRPELLRLFADFDIEHLDEVEKEGSDAMGGTKHHHVFHIVARKRASQS